MNRSMTWLGVLLACVFVLAACSSSGPGKTPTTETIGNSVPATDPPTVPARPIPVTACSLIARAEVEKLLGAVVVGVETDHQPTNKFCTWTVTPNGGGSPLELDLGVIRIGNGQVGFGSTVVGMTPTVVEGLGNVASFSTGVNASGSPQRLLVAKNSSVSLSISVKYGSSPVPSESVEPDMIAIAQAIFAKLP